MDDYFSAIRPYSEKEATEAFKQLFQCEDFINALRLFEPKINVEKILKEAHNYQSIYDFQKAVAKDFVEYFIDETTAGVTFSGLENLDPNKNYLFLANHRDIVFDTALLQYYFMVNDYQTSKIAIGDNLLATPLLEVVGKINKMITVKRSVSIREKLENYRILSEYIHYSIEKERQSVWIAQRNGRTKNGIDKTQHGLMKMLSMSDSKDAVASLKKINIVPVSVSYELEVCDNLKARELAISEHMTYEKKPGEDFESIRQGLFGQKGRVSLVIGKVINDELDTIPDDMLAKDKIEMACDIADRQIYANYQLYPTNYIAYDLLHETDDFANHYTIEEKESFVTYLNNQSICPDVTEKKMQSNLLQIYANPVKIIENK
ncbi:1-acyl-sn-glycerol-3-phosphate acyltransferase [Bacteroidales bacterium OttesenSCG-928-B11]|nr:1-acyl-sn-glycerol-3-phosphate acyltransferase [Bacteroidales bacterium OttesenSCG-928-E04]MDL2312514.1 1-acyl-sn-glycerol-3-phosphate acyltransferase [Bacteroidales bacterium OttesenSCG-928-B11]